MTEYLQIALIIIALITATATPVKALNGNACTVEYLARGTYITQTAGETGTINAYVNEPVTGKKYKTTIYRLNQRFYVTNKKDVAVSGEDAGGIVC